VGAVLLGDRRLAAVRCHDLAVVQIRGEVSVDLLRCGLFGLVGR
jgi:hypothetical protein